MLMLWFFKSYDQLVELKVDLDSVKQNTKDRQGSLTNTNEPNGLDILLAASDSVGHQPPRTQGMGNSPSDGTFGVCDAMGALDGASLLDFLHDNWNANSFDPTSGLPVAQSQFDWEDANLYGNPGNM